MNEATREQVLEHGEGLLPARSIGGVAVRGNINVEINERNAHLFALDPNSNVPVLKGTHRGIMCDLLAGSLVSGSRRLFAFIDEKGKFYDNAELVANHQSSDNPTHHANLFNMDSSATFLADDGEASRVVTLPVSEIRVLGLAVPLESEMSDAATRQTHDELVMAA